MLEHSVSSVSFNLSSKKDESVFFSISVLLLSGKVTTNSSFSIWHDLERLSVTVKRYLLSNIVITVPLFNSKVFSFFVRINSYNANISNVVENVFLIPKNTYFFYLFCNKLLTKLYNYCIIIRVQYLTQYKNIL